MQAEFAVVVQVGTVDDGAKVRIVEEVAIAGAPPLWGLTRLADQQVAGLIMWLVMDIPLLVGITILFFSWINGLERAQRLAETSEMEEGWRDDEDHIWQSEGAAPRAPHHV